MFCFKKFLPVIVLLGLMPLIMAAGPNDNRAYSASHFVLELDQGTKITFEKKESDGEAKCQDVNKSSATRNAVYKITGHVSDIDITFDGGAEIENSSEDWIQAFFKPETTTELKLEPTGIEFPNLTITMVVDDFQEWQHFYDDFVTSNHCVANAEVKGRITWLGPDLQEELATITFKHISISEVELDKA